MALMISMRIRSSTWSTDAQRLEEHEQFNRKIVASAPVGICILRTLDGTNIAGIKMRRSYIRASANSIAPLRILRTMALMISMRMEEHEQFNRKIVASAPVGICILRTLDGTNILSNELAGQS
jgi:hypothetical protein